MALIGRTLGQRNITLKSDTAEAYEDKTIFTIKILSAKEGAELQDTVAKSAGGSLVYTCVERALCGWKNFQDESGKEIPFDRKNPKNNLDLLGLSLMAELAEEIMTLSFPDPEGNLEKN